MNVSVLKMVILIIGAIEVLTLALTGLLLLNEKPVPDVFATVIVAGITGMLGLLAPSREAIK